MFLISLFISQVALAAPSPTPFPVFLKEGFSTILEFEDKPTQVVLGDSNLFQVENVGKSIVIKPLVPYATTNMFVYFKTKETRLFILAASEDSEPTYFKRFTALVPPTIPEVKHSRKKYSRGATLRNADFDTKKDFLTVDVEIAADAKEKLVPSWDLVRLKQKDRSISPSKLWAERREAQKDSSIRARFIFMKPNVSANLKGAILIVPLKGSIKPFAIDLQRSLK